MNTPVSSPRCFEARHSPIGDLNIAKELADMRAEAIAHLTRQPSIAIAGLSELDRAGRFTVANHYWAQCSDEAKRYLLNDEHAHVRSAAAMAARRADTATFPAPLPKAIPDYQAFDGDKGEFTRKAKIIGELPTPDMRLRACQIASERLGLRVEFGVKLKHTNAMTPAQVKEDGRSVLELAGHDLPLSLFWGE